MWVWFLERNGMSTETDSHANVTIENLAANEYATRTLTIDFLFLDREVCERCGGTEESLHAALDRVADVLADLGIEVSVRNIHVENEEAARQTDFEISPTIRIAGQDIQPEYIETACESCGDLCNCGEGFDNDTVIDCRSWLYRGEEYTTPPIEFIIEELLRAALAERGVIDDHSEMKRYRFPENLQNFFDESTTHSDELTDDSESLVDHESCC